MSSKHNPLSSVDHASLTNQFAIKILVLGMSVHTVARLAAVRPVGRVAPSQRNSPPSSVTSQNCHPDDAIRRA